MLEMIAMPEVGDIFKRVEAGKRDILATKSASLERELLSPHQVRLPKGIVPEYVRLTPYQQFCWSIMKNLVEAKAHPKQELEDNLIKAHMKIRPEEYIAVVWMTTLISGIVAGVLGGVLAGILAILVKGFIFLIGFVIMIIIPFFTFLIMMSLPKMKTSSRRRNIDRRISSSMSFISAMASADVNIDVIFKELARQPIYGEIKEEAEWITRDTELLGQDILSAIKKGAARSPSSKWQDFLQGVVTTVTSGGQLKPYFLVKADQFEKEDKLDDLKRMETLGMLAETFVTVVVAFPLFLVIILALMALVGGQGRMTLGLLWAIIAVMIPGSQFGFIFFIKALSEEV